MLPNGRPAPPPAGTPLFSARGRCFTSHSRRTRKRRPAAPRSTPARRGGAPAYTSRRGLPALCSFSRRPMSVVTPGSTRWRRRIGANRHTTWLSLVRRPPCNGLFPLKKQPFKRVPNPARKLHAGHPGFNPAPKGKRTLLSRIFYRTRPYRCLTFNYLKLLKTNILQSENN